MLFAGSDDGVYRVSGVDESDESTTERVLDAGRAMRVRQFDRLDGLFAATETGLYRSPDGEAWTDLGVPRERVYAVVASPSGDRLYAGTRPAHVYVAPVEDGRDGLAWRECEGFQDLPSREEWHTPRHDDIAQVRSLCTHPDAPERVVAGVEVGGVHVSDDGGATWTERRGAVNDDVHHLHVVGADEWVAATGFGLYRTTDAGRSWTRLDDGDRRYIREAFTHDGVLYAGGAYGSSSTWDERSGYAVYECRDDEVRTVAYPTPDEVVLGWCSVDGDVLGSTHRGTVLRRRDGEWRRVGTVPVPGDVGGRYIPLSWYEP